MQDRPTPDELLATVERFLESEVMSRGDRAFRFQGRIAANAVKIVRRDLAARESDLDLEWKSLRRLLDLPPPGPAPTEETLAGAVRKGNEELCRRIEQGAADEPPFRDAVRRHLRMTVRQKLLVSNPKWLGAADR